MIKQIDKGEHNSLFNKAIEALALNDILSFNTVFPTLISNFQTTLLNPVDPQDQHQSQKFHILSMLTNCKMIKSEFLSSSINTLYQLLKSNQHSPTKLKLYEKFKLRHDLRKTEGIIKTFTHLSQISQKNRHMQNNSSQAYNEFSQKIKALLVETIFEIKDKNQPQSDTQAILSAIKHVEVLDYFSLIFSKLIGLIQINNNYQQNQSKRVSSKLYPQFNEQLLHQKNKVLKNKKSIFQSIFYNKEYDCKKWFSNIKNYATSYALISFIQSTIKLGDRHLQNLFIESNSLKFNLIDLECVFGKKTAQSFMELNQFRLDNMLMQSFGTLSVFSSVLPAFYDIAMSTSKGFTWDNLYKGTQFFNMNQRSKVLAQLQLTKGAIINNSSAKFRVIENIHEMFKRSFDPNVRSKMWFRYSP